MNRHLKTFLASLLLAALIVPGAFGFPTMLPDPKLTPGKVAVSPADTRGVSAEMREAVFARYRVLFENRRGYVVDHLIPRELGGADAIENLWPQRINARPYPARRKQRLAAELAKLVASGKMTLAEAQTEIREDWISSFVTHIGMVYLSPSVAAQHE